MPSSLPPRATPQLLRIGTPIALSGLSFAVMSAVDTAFVTGLGVHALAGVGLAGTMAFTIMMPAIALLRAVKISVANARGAGEDDSGYVGAALRIAALATAPSMLGIFGLATVTDWFLTTREAAGAASDYLAIRGLSVPFFLLGICLREVFYGRGDTRTPLSTILVANVVNAVANYVGVFHFDGGVRAVAWATLLAEASQAALLAYAMRRRGFGWRAATPAHRRAILEIGLPYAAQRMVESLAFSFMAAMVARVGVVASAAHQLAVQLLLLGNLPSMALGDATSILAAQDHGAGDHGRLRVLGADALRIGLLWTGTLGVLAWLAIPLLAPRMAPGAEHEVVLAIRACAVFLVLEGVSLVAQGLLRASGDPRFPSMIVTVNATLVSPLLCVLAIELLGWGSLAAWSAFGVEALLSGALLWARVRVRNPAPIPALG